MRTLLAVIGVTLVAALVITVGTDLGVSQLVETDTEQTPIIANGEVLVRGSETVDDIWVVRGNVTVRGRVEDDIHVLSGRVRVAGSVGGDITVYRGRVTVTDRGAVGGDIRSSAEPILQPNANIVGRTDRTNLLDAVRDIPRPIWLALWVAAGLGVLVVVAGMRHFASAALRTASSTAGRRALPSLALGLAVLAGLGLLTVIGIGSVVGLGLGALAGSAFLLLTALGAAVTAALLARLLTGGEPAPLALLAGWLALGAAIAFALLVDPFLAVVLTAPIAGLGAGALLLPHLRSGHDKEDEDEPGDTSEEPATDVLEPLSRWRSAAASASDAPLDLTDRVRPPLFADDRSSGTTPTVPDDGIEMAVRAAIEEAASGSGRAGAVDPDGDDRWSRPPVRTHDGPTAGLADRRVSDLALADRPVDSAVDADAVPDVDLVRDVDLKPTRSPETIVLPDGGGPAGDRSAGGPVVPPRAFRPANGPGTMPAGARFDPDGLRSTAEATDAPASTNGQAPEAPTVPNETANGTSATGISGAEKVEAEVVASLPPHVRQALPRRSRRSN